jgi:hypothetical protein
MHRGSHAESLRGEEDSEFADPAGSFRGLPRFKQNRTNFGSLLEKLNMKLTKCALSFILLSVYADLSLHNQGAVSGVHVRYMLIDLEF